MPVNARVTSLHLFAVRSCAGQSLDQATLSTNGLLFDRQWRLVSPDGKFLTQRECPRMALILPAVVEGRLTLSLLDSTPPADTSTASAPLAPYTAALGDSENPAIAISETCFGIDQGDAVAAWLTTALVCPARLLRVSNAAGDSDFRRPDMSEVLIISEESLADLNSRLDEPVRMNRFRPNIVVSGVEPYGEEAWKRVTIGGVVFVESSEPCGRCPMINVDQEKGEKSGKEPLKTLAKYRRQNGPVIFGKYMVPENAGIVRVGDQVS